jgi:hypothetical protein
LTVHNPPQDPPDSGTDSDGSSAHQRALARLVASRQRLQATWLPSPDPAAGARGTRRGGRVAVLWRYWRRQLHDQPLAFLALAAAEQWWQHNPWHLAGRAVATEVDALITPWLRRHPGLTVALAAGTGFAVVRARPWRWPGVADPLRSLRRLASRWLRAQLTQLPLQSLLTGLAMAREWSSTAPGAAAASAHPVRTDAAQPDLRHGPVGVV